jgi:hypothetical protein
LAGDNLAAVRCRVVGARTALLITPMAMWLSRCATGSSWIVQRPRRWWPGWCLDAVWLLSRTAT